jgi:hypothetical protein
MKELLYLLRDREPVPTDDVHLWGRWFEKADRTVLRTELIDGSVISTVFLGVDHGWGGEPLLFETAVFFAPNTAPTAAAQRLCDIARRYTTWSQAECGHVELVDELSIHSVAARFAAMATPTVPKDR